MGLLSEIFSGGAASLVTSVGDAIDKNITSDEERKELDNELAKAKLRHEIEMTALGLQARQAAYGDIASARDNQSRVQESANASWLAKNVQPILAFAIMGTTFAVFALVILFGKENSFGEMKDLVVYILGALTTVATQVVSYFFGSSAGSAEKTKTIGALVTPPRQP